MYYNENERGKKQIGQRNEERKNEIKKERKTEGKKENIKQVSWV